jgi:hypothetical protein
MGKTFFDLCTCHAIARKAYYIRPSSLIIAYQDDNLMTKYHAQVHPSVMCLGYTVVTGMSNKLLKKSKVSIIKSHI